MYNEIQQQILDLKREKQALILAHNYQAVEIQDIADYTGDSLQLSLQAADAKTPLIVFCGVRFMAETAALLNPAAKVLLPVAEAGCPMADMITADQLRMLKAEHPGAAVICYVNSTAEVKSESDICCTSSNAVQVMQSVPPEQEILFVPDMNLGTWAASQTRRKVTVWEGYCYVHHLGFSSRDVETMRREHPGYTLLAHPECAWEVVSQADQVMSTSGMLRYAESHDKLILATENGLIDLLNARHPDRSILSLNRNAVCEDMKKTGLRDVLQALQTGRHEVKVEPAVASKAVDCLQRMLALSRR